MKMQLSVAIMAFFNLSEAGQGGTLICTFRERMNRISPLM